MSRIQHGLSSCEPINSDLVAQFFGRSRRLFIERRASRVSDAIDRVEKTGDTCGVYEHGFTHRVYDRGARPSETLIVVSENSLSEFNQQCAVRNPSVARMDSTGDGHEIECNPRMLAARTEQLRMAGGSIGTLIQRGDTGC